MDIEKHSCGLKIKLALVDPSTVHHEIEDTAGLGALDLERIH